MSKSFQEKYGLQQTMDTLTSESLMRINYSQMRQLDAITVFLEC